MTDLTYTQLGGILVAIIVLTGAGTVYVQESTGYKSCSTGWVLQDNGQFVCESRDLDPQWCYKFSKPNPEGISSRCYLGVVFEEEEIETLPKPINQIQGSGEGWHWEEIDGKTYLCREGKCVLNGEI